MRTYNFIYRTRDGKEEQVEINADSEGEAWRQLMELPVEFTYIDLMP